MPDFISSTIQVHIAKYDEKHCEYEQLLLLRSETAEPYPSLWQVVTGRIEEGETALETALREVYEETGLEPMKIWTIPYITTFFNVYQNKIHASPVFGFLVQRESIVKISEEHSGFQWLNWDQSVERLELPSHREASVIFMDYILNNPKGDMFLFSDSLLS
ncbi:MAG: dihydroneopterin triphosphate diphosphatase [Bacteroidota bacterium]|nr:dihydroneopterin triphosphate diphosphatase [Bacteroidota bacterium]